MYPDHIKFLERYIKIVFDNLDDDFSNRYVSRHMHIIQNREKLTISSDYTLEYFRTIGFLRNLTKASGHRNYGYIRISPTINKCTFLLRSLLKISESGLSGYNEFNVDVITIAYITNHLSYTILKPNEEIITISRLTEYGKDTLNMMFNRRICKCLNQLDTRR